MRARASSGSRLSHSTPISAAKPSGAISGWAMPRHHSVRPMRFLVWTGVEEWLAESAAVDLGGDGLSATGTQLGADPGPFRVDYRLEAPGFVTRELELTATAEGWQRRLLLRHDGSGAWDADVQDEGQVPGGPWDGSLPELSEAVDIDIENSPLT